MDKPARIDQALEAVRNFKPMSQAAQKKLLAKTREAALTGRFEPFKTDTIFDGTANSPKWLGGTSGTEVKPSAF
jgi:hypothetical protein